MGHAAAAAAAVVVAAAAVVVAAAAAVSPYHPMYLTQHHFRRVGVWTVDER